MFWELKWDTVSKNGANREIPSTGQLEEVGETEETGDWKKHPVDFQESWEPTTAQRTLGE